MRTWVLALLVGCGETSFPRGEPLGHATNLTIVAHPDDELVFMGPDQLDAALTGDGLTNVYVTAGNGREGLGTAVDRYAGLMAAYTAATGGSGWSCGTIDLAAHPVEHCQLAETRLSLVLIGYPDGGKQGEYPGSLLQLWDGTVVRSTTIAQVETSYDRDQLVEVLSTVIEATQATTIRTLEIASIHGRDHSDHMMTGALTLLAVAAIGSSAELTAYRGYATSDAPENVSDAHYDRSANVLAYYDACVIGCAVCGEPCPTISESHAAWLRRRYAVERRVSATGELRSGGMCAIPGSDGEIVLSECTTSITWSLSPDGLLRIGERCLHALPTGELALDRDCSGAASNRFVLDDEGHLWLGAPPLPQPDMDYAHLQCIGVSGGRLRASLCGADHAPTWIFSPALVPTQ